MAIVGGSMTAILSVTGSSVRRVFLLLCVSFAVAALADIAPCPPGAHAQGKAPPDGSERKCLNADGLAEGPWLTWYGNGQLLSERHMKQGREHGRQRSWWPNGQLMMEGISHEGNRYKGFKYWSIGGEPTTLNIETDTVTRSVDKPTQPTARPAP